MAFNFKDPEEVKLYLKNIYTEYRFGCESEKKGDACHLLGDYMESIDHNHEEAASIYKSNCDERNWARSCAKFAGYKSVGRGCEKDMQEAFTYMKKSCDFDDPRGCVKAGVMATSRDFKLEGDRAELLKSGIKFLEKACNKFDNEQGCFFLSGIYLGALKGEIEPDLKQAFRLSLKSCEAGNPYACANISRMYSIGEGAEKNAILSASFKERAQALHKETVQAKEQLQFQRGIES